MKMDLLFRSIFILYLSRTKELWLLEIIIIKIINLELGKKDRIKLIGIQKILFTTLLFIHLEFTDKLC